MPGELQQSTGPALWAWIPWQLGWLPGVLTLLLDVPPWPSGNSPPSKRITLELEVKGRAWWRHTGMCKRRSEPSPCSLSGGNRHLLKYTSQKPRAPLPPWPITPYGSPSPAYYNPSASLRAHTFSIFLSCLSLGYYKIASYPYTLIFFTEPQWMAFAFLQGTKALSLQLEATRALAILTVGADGAPVSVNVFTLNPWVPVFISRSCCNKLPQI